ncbi:656_t:CDS:1, partial [Dentiscutata heterogama]
LIQIEKKNNYENENFDNMFDDWNKTDNEDENYIDEEISDKEEEQINEIENENIISDEDMENNELD